MKLEDLSIFHNRIFRLEELGNVFREPLPSIKMQLSRLHKRGILIRLKRNCYTFQKYPPDPLLIGQELVKPAYYSLEWILSRAGIIPEGVSRYTLVTTQKTKRWTTPFGVYEYRHLPPRLFFGVDQHSDGVWCASPEKALLDYLYLNSQAFRPKISAWQAERLDELDTLDWQKMNEWAPRYGMKKLVRLLASLKVYAKSPLYQEHR